MLAMECASAPTAILALTVLASLNPAYLLEHAITNRYSLMMKKIVKKTVSANLTVANMGNV